ncbi:MAG TPA: hypothetical protein PKD55_15240 [Bellilinea sp.]|nr:hypothetical protein [Bellilinea sp.]
MDEDATHRRRSIDFAIGGRQHERDLVAFQLLNQVADAPALAMHASQVVGDQRDHVVIAQALLQR